MSVDFQAPLTLSDVENLFKIILKREVDNPAWAEHLVSQQDPFGRYLARLVSGKEFTDRVIRAAGAAVPSPAKLDDHAYRLPSFLAVSENPPRQIALIGSCLLDDWGAAILEATPGLAINRIVFNHASQLPQMGQQEAATYDFQILQVPLASILRGASLFNLKFSDTEGYAALFDATCQLMEHNLAALLLYNEQFGMLSFVLNFCVPQQNAMGRMIDRYSLTNPVYFFEQLNRKLHDYVASRKNCTIIDFDQITAMFGKKFFQDDSVLQSNHASSLRDIRQPDDFDRLEPTGSVNEIYTPNARKYILTAWHEALSHRRTLQQTDSVKLVIFDLDDTLWRGVAAERGAASVEGWPLGVVEAAAYLWKRGILVAIASKNDEQTVRAIWAKAHRFSLDNFVSIQINWNSKAENVGKILRDVNVLPGSVLFVDDNPVERAAVRQAFPDMRVMDAPLVHWRRILLWSAELQRAALTDEAVARTEMIQAQVERETQRSGMDHDDFLASLETQISARKIADSGDKAFARCFELLNKTNQFNTTGRRWGHAEIEDWFAAGGCIIALEIGDRFTDYGITGLLVMINDVIEQFVLSCRVFGMRIEHAAVAIAQMFGGQRIFGRIVPTAKNHLCVDLYRGLGFTEFQPGFWLYDQGELDFPTHILLTTEESVPAYAMG